MNRKPIEGVVAAVCRSARHAFSKPPQLMVRLIAGHGVEGDAHAGETVKHRSRVARDPSQPNLRQVHLIAAETHETLRAEGFDVGPGDMGENVTTRGIDLFALPTDAVLRLGASAAVRITGLRNPCTQLDRFQAGLMAATLGRDEAGAVTFRAGVMGVVVRGGEVRPGDSILVEAPPPPYRPLQRV
jgi:MOSC domain-containing protein YiiM